MSTAPCRKALHTILAVVGIAVAGACSTENTAHPPDADVRDPLTCSVDATGTVRAAGEVTNQSSGTSFYMIDIAFSRDGDVIEHRTVALDDVAPGETVGFEAALVDAPRDTSCTLHDVDRLSA